MLDTDIVRIMTLEVGHMMSLKIPAAMHHLRDGLAEMWLKAVIDALEVQKTDTLRGRLVIEGHHIPYHSAVQLYLVGVIADRTCAEAFLLEDQTFVQPLATLLRGNAEVHVCHLLVALVDEMTEQQIQSPPLTSLVARGDILDMSHLASDKHQAPRHNLTFVAHQKQLDLLRKA